MCKDFFDHFLTLKIIALTLENARGFLASDPDVVQIVDAAVTFDGHDDIASVTENVEGDASKKVSG